MVKKLYTKKEKNVIKELKDLSKEELLYFIEMYDGYVIECCDEGNIPVCVDEFLINDYPVLKHIDEIVEKNRV